MRPLVFGYLRLQPADPPQIGARLTAEMRAYAEREGLMLADVYTDHLDPPANHPNRSAFCALMDALRRHDASGVVIPTPQHLSRQPGSYAARRTIIEAEVGARLHVVAPSPANLSLPR
jgi:hypothetical protein